MVLYYCINDVLDSLEKMEVSEKRFLSLIPVSPLPIECGGYQDDSFILASTPKLLDLREADSAYQLAQLMEEVPLYGINIELVLDEALYERHKNVRIANALNQAFAGQPLPNTLRGGDRSEEDLSGGLRHPMLAHMDKIDLCQLYITFMKFLEREHHQFSFERSIIGKHMERFLDRFDGYASAEGGKVKAGILLAFGARLDHDPGMPLESLVEASRKQAGKMRIDEPHELVWAWVDAEAYQMRRCFDLERVMKLQGLPRTPNWVRTDIFACLGKEAMKQVFAKGIAQKDAKLALLDKAPALQEAIRANADGKMDEALQAMMAQTRSQKAAYAGEALRFAQGAQKRSAEAKKHGLV